MLDKRTAFKVAFLRNCAEKGLSLEETHELVKAASNVIEKKSFLGGAGRVLSKALDVGENLAGKAVNWGVPAALLAPPVLGGAVGYGLGTASGQLSDVDLDEVKDQEKIEALRRAIARVKLDNTLAEQRKNKPRPSRPLI